MSYLGQQLGQGQAERFVFTASGGETSVTTSDDGRAIAYTVGQVDVYLNGAKLINGSDFTATTGTSITGLAALTASDVVEVFALSIFQASDTVSASTGGTFNGNVTINAGLTVSAAVPSIQMTDTDNNADAYIQATDGNLRFYADDNAEAAGSLITFNIDGGEKARIDESGNVGLGNGAYIGTLSSTHSLSIQGGAGAPGGKITLYGGTGSNRMDFFIGASEAMRIDSSRNLLVGTTGTSSAVAGTVIYGGSLAGVITHTYAGRPLYINRLSTDGDIIELAKDGTTVGSIGSHSGIYTYIGTDDTALLFAGNIDAVIPFSPSASNYRDNAIDVGTSSYRFKDLYLSGGVYLGGTGAANHLDDYEEGTWTPVLSGTGYTFGTHTGTYVKIGRIVHVTAFLNITAVGTNTSALGAISGFPFNANSATNQYQIGIVRQTSTTGRLYVAQINYNTNSGGINSMDGVTAGDNEIFTTGNYGLSLTYIST